MVSDRLLKAADQIRSGDPRALARAATAIENRDRTAATLLALLFPHTGRAFTIGITGPPGVGKSTLTGEMVRVLRAKSKSVGVLAVDPTSPYTGGAILGDRIRMQKHHADPGVFIRSMATRGQLGGLASATTDLALLLDAAGMDYILIETVGVGQDEVDVARLAYATAVVLVPNMGDDVQAIKAGIMEIADVYIINKADQPGVEKLEREIEFLLGLSPRADGWKPPIVRSIAAESQGIEEALQAIESFKDAKLREPQGVEMWSRRLREMLRDRLADTLDDEEVRAAAAEVAARRKDPYTIVNDWLKRIQP
ncbi:MAG: methylmalonyl Co-A mutase-associated GTPase MeaB [Bryobacteraceae bacterium]